MGATTVRTAWRNNSLKPHLSRTFKVSRDPRFEDKLLDVVGLYLNPPEHALVLSCDEKSQIQALNRTQPGLPVKTGRAGTVTHDYKRDGTTTVFAALNTLDGRVVSMCRPDAASGGGQLRHAQRRPHRTGSAVAPSNIGHSHIRIPLADRLASTT